MEARLPGLNIEGVATYVPENHSYFDQELDQYSQNIESSEKLKAVMGYDKHHYLKDPMSFTAFSKLALEHFFEKNSVEIASIDALIVVCQSPDHFLPNNSSKIHGMFPFRSDCYCVDLPDGCSGYLRGLTEAGMLLNSTSVRRILLISGDILSLKVSRRDRNSFPLIGDAVSLSLISIDPESIAVSEFRSKGEAWDAIAIPAGGYALPAVNGTSEMKVDEEGNFRALDNLIMKGRDVFTFTQTIVVEFAGEFLRKYYGGDQPDYVFSHQPNKFILDRIKKRLKISDSSMVTNVVSIYGNSSSATIPIAMALQARSGGLLTKPFSAMLLGFGVGLTWAGMKIQNKALKFCYIEELEA